MRPGRARPLRRIVAVSACVVLVGACGGGGKKHADDGAVAVGSDALLPTTTVAGGAAGSSTAPAQAGSTATTARTAATAATSKPQPTAPPLGTAPPTTTHAARPTADQLGLNPIGSFSPWVLGERSPYTSIRIELLVQSGLGPRGDALDHLTTVLQDVSGKAVATSAPKGLPPGDGPWSQETLIKLADEYGTHNTGSDAAVLHVLYVHGQSADSASILGQAERGDVLAMFPDREDSAATPTLSARTIERAALTHEAGHLLGLVDFYLHTGRQDAAHPGHSTNKKSVMYWGLEQADVVGQLSGGPPTEFDAADKADLATIRTQH